MIFKQITLPDNSTIYFIDNKRTSAQNFEYKNVLCNVQNKKTCNLFSGFTKSGNRFFQCTKY